MPDVRFHGSIGQVTTRPTKDGEPETIVQIKMDGFPSDVVQLMRCVGKGGTVTFAPYQREFPLHENGAVQGELWDVAPARTVDAPEPSEEQAADGEQQESAGPALPITWRIVNERPEAVDANGVPLGLFAEFRAVWGGEQCDVWVVTLPTGHEQEIGGADMTSEEAQRIAVEMAFPELTPPLPWRVGEWEQTDSIGQAWEVYAEQTIDVEAGAIWNQPLTLNWERYYGGFSAVWVATLPDGNRVRVSPENVAVADEQARANAQAQAILRAWGESAIVSAAAPTDEATIEECEEIVAQADADEPIDPNIPPFEHYQQITEAGEPFELPVGIADPEPDEPTEN